MNKEHIAEHIKESFVARIWLEPGDNGDVMWRGHIRHVQGMSGVTGPALTAQPLEEAMKSKSGTVTNIKKKD